MNMYVHTIAYVFRALTSQKQLKMFPDKKKSAIPSLFRRANILLLMCDDS